jgi:hypothetical protein
MLFLRSLYWRLYYEAVLCRCRRAHLRTLWATDRVSRRLLVEPVIEWTGTGKAITQRPVC